jgi:hypothetical protein
LKEREESLNAIKINADAPKGQKYPNWTYISIIIQPIIFGSQPSKRLKARQAHRF